MKLLIKVFFIIVAVALLVGAGAWYVRRDKATAVTYKTVQIKRDNVVSTISATGSIEPEDLIDVGAQVGGQIIEFGKDESSKPIDYRSNVKQGQLLARIDDAVYKAKVQQAQAAQTQAQAGIQLAEANLLQSKAKLDQAKRDWDRAQKLGPSDALAQMQYDAYRSAYDQAQANISVGDASIAQAKATLIQAEANLTQEQRNLEYCTINAPVSGVIIARRVNIGQTVVASLDAPSLFLIAKDLRRMQVWVAVNEADVGSIFPGQPVTFSCDAFPDQTFSGQVDKVRLNAQMTQNVVTYTVEVSTDNSSGQLLPYLTANCLFETARRDNVLTVPNAALRFTPDEAQVAPESQNSDEAGAPAETGERHNNHATSRPAGATSRPAVRQYHRATLWVKSGEFLKSIRVRAGVTDGISTEVVSDELSDGMEIVSGVAQETAMASSASTNPLGPPQFRRNNNNGGSASGRTGGSTAH